ncbi:MAG TPA: LuxR C-terminal-related transcriptional regulator [Bacteroidia bacterium]|nr:LuxR C-terminal-related transcriptional regulator [Bacteroidia bacterium]
MKPILEYIKPLRSIFEISSDGILITTRSGKIIYFNPLLSKLINATPAALKGKNCTLVFPDLNCEAIDKKLFKKKSVNGTVSFPVGKKSSGKEIQLMACHLGSEENPIGIQFIFRNPSKTTEKEKFSPKNQSILKVMDNRPDIGWIVSDVQTGKNLFASSGMEALTGWTKEEYIDGGWGFGLSIIHEDDVEKTMEVFKMNLDKRNHQPFVHDHLTWETVFRYKKKDKGYIRIKVLTSVLERDSNQMVKFLIASFSLFNKSSDKKEMSSSDSSQHDSIRIIDGKPYINLEFLQSLRKNKLLSPANDDLPELSERELEVLLLTSEGLSSEQIADKLHVSSHTIKTHRKMLLKKLGAKNAAELIRKAEKMGFF